MSDLDLVYCWLLIGLGSGLGIFGWGLWVNMYVNGN